jgi:bacillithiol system protein YtxJ
MVKDCNSDEDYRQLVEASKERPVFLYKHSTVCPLSKTAWERFSEFSEQEQGPEFWRILVREHKDLARQIAKETEIPHESPQVILFQDGQAIWKASSRGINADNMARQIKRLK